MELPGPVVWVSWCLRCRHHHHLVLRLRYGGHGLGCFAIIMLSRQTWKECPNYVYLVVGINLVILILPR